MSYVTQFCLHHSASTGPSLEFSSYSVSEEDGFVEVCVTFRAAASTAVTAYLETQDGTAVGVFCRYRGVIYNEHVYSRQWVRFIQGVFYAVGYLQGSRLSARQWVCLYSSRCVILGSGCGICKARPVGVFIQQ